MDRQSRLSVIWEEEEIPLEAMNSQHFEEPANGSRVDSEAQATPRKMTFRKIIFYVFLVLSGLIAIAGGYLLAVGQTEIGHNLTGQVTFDNKTQGIIQQASVPEVTTTQYLSTVEPTSLLPDQVNKTKSEGNLRASLFLSYFSHAAFVAMSTRTVPMSLVTSNQANYAVQDVELGYLHGPPQAPSMGELRHESGVDGNQAGDLALFVAGLGTIILVIIIFSTILVRTILKIRRRH